MTSYFPGFVDFVGAHPHYALTAVFLLALGRRAPDRAISAGRGMLDSPLFFPLLAATLTIVGMLGFGIYTYLYPYAVVY
jgi:hypothetical protein